MEFTQVQISKADNGFIVSTTKIVFGEQRPEQGVKVFKTFEEVVEFLSPAKPKLATS